MPPVFRNAPGCCCEEIVPPCRTRGFNVFAQHCAGISLVYGALIEVRVDDVLVASAYTADFLFGLAFRDLPIKTEGSHVDITVIANRWQTQTQSYDLACVSNLGNINVQFNMIPASGYHCCPCFWPQPPSLTFTDPQGSVALTYNTGLGIWISPCTSRIAQLGFVRDALTLPKTCAFLSGPQPVNVFFISNGCGASVYYPICSSFHNSLSNDLSVAHWTDWPGGFVLDGLGTPDTASEYPGIPLSLAWSISGSHFLYGTGTHNFTLTE